MKKKTHIKLYTSTKSTLLEDRVQKDIDELEEENYIIDKISSCLSFSGDRGYMILCQIIYHEEVLEEDEIHMYEWDSDLSTGMSFSDHIDQTI